MDVAASDAPNKIKVRFMEFIQKELSLGQSGTNRPKDNFR